MGALTLDLRFYRVDNRIEVVRVGMAKPVRDIRRLTRLLCDKLETVDPGFGVEVMVLAAPSAEPLSWKPVASDLTEAALPDVADLVDHAQQSARLKPALQGSTCAKRRPRAICSKDRPDLSPGR